MAEFDEEEKNVFCFNDEQLTRELYHEYEEKFKSDKIPVIIDNGLCSK